MFSRAATNDSPITGMRIGFAWYRETITVERKEVKPTRIPNLLSATKKLHAASSEAIASAVAPAILDPAKRAACSDSGIEGTSGLRMAGADIGVLTVDRASRCGA